MSDTYLDLVNGPLRGIAKKLGLPAPVPLRRFSPDDPQHGYLAQPVLVAGATPGAEALAGLLVDAGFSVQRAADPGQRYSAIIAAYDGAQTPADLQDATLAVGTALRGLVTCGRVITLSDAPATADEAAAAPVGPALNAARGGVTGILRSAAHEMRSGSTANGILLDGVGPESPSVAAALWFLLSAKSAYVSGQFLTVDSERGRRIGAADFAATGDSAAAPLAGRVAVVTGAARGIGAAIVEVLRRDGAQVYGVDVPAAGQALADTMNRVRGTAIQADITASDAADTIAAAVGRPIDILIHNAGITRDKMLANMDAGRWSSVLGVNVLSQLRMDDRFDELGAWGDAPHVVSLASTSGIAGNRGQTNYAASKAGVIGMAAAAADSFARRSGSINAVAPGFIETEMTKKMPVLTRQVARRLSSLAQGGLPRDVAEAIAFLASDAAAGINGRTLRVCGQNMVGA